MLNRAIKFLIENKPVAILLLFLFTCWGLYHAPFSPENGIFPNNAVAVDAIPDIGENQQIVYTSWDGRSPQDIEDQITYPLSAQLLGIPGVKTIRSSSMFGFSSIYIIFEDDIDFYWSRSRILEKLNSLPQQILPQGVNPSLGPDATAMGQVFWYTLEGRDADGKVTGGWDLHELRSIQDFYVKNALTSVKGISEVASIGGFVQEYQIDIKPELLRQYKISLQEVISAVKQNNRDVGAKTLEINQVEYFVRGLGYVRSVSDIEEIAVSSEQFTPIQIRDIATVSLGPAERRGILDKGGAEVVGGVAVAQYNANPMQVIQSLKKKIELISPGLPKRQLQDGSTSQLTIVPFYDRSQLINETLQTLNRTLIFEILITILVVLVMLRHLSVSLMISGLMPIVVLIVFITMKIFGVDANIVALSGIAIAIGTVVDMGIILTENIVGHLEKAPRNRSETAIYEATKEVSGAILTAGLTTIVSFIPVFSLTGAEGKLFSPLAFTKTVALSAAVLVSLLMIPPVAALLLRKRDYNHYFKIGAYGLLGLVGIWGLFSEVILGIALLTFAVIGFLKHLDKIGKQLAKWSVLGLGVLFLIIMLAVYWRPLGVEHAIHGQLIFVILVCLLVLGSFFLFRKYYTRMLSWALENKKLFLSFPLLLVILGVLIWFNTEKEFMPSLDEGAYLLMPTSMPHAGTAEAKQVLTQLDMAVASLPEVDMVVGKAGRAETAIDPAPLSMYENLITYKPEFIADEEGSLLRFRTNKEGLYETKQGNWISSGTAIDPEYLVPDTEGEYFRNWRPHIQNREDIWAEISRISALPGVTLAPKLQPMETRLVMLQTGMRADMGIKIKAQSLEQIEAFGQELEGLIERVAGIKPESVFADRVVSKPYLEIEIDRSKIARYGLSAERVQEVIEVALGGKILTETVEGRESYSIRVRYPRELRGSPEDIGSIYVDLEGDNAVPLSELVSVNFRRGPQIIKSEDSFLVGYLIFDKEDHISEVTAVNRISTAIREALKEGTLDIPAGLSYEFAGTYENQLRAEKKLSLIVPLVLIVILLLLYLQFRSISVSLMVFSGVAVSFAGGFLLIWLFGQSWFLDFSILGSDLRDVFNVRLVNLSVAVWVGFIALFGIATDDGVVMATYLKQAFERSKPKGVSEIRRTVIEAGNRRIRPCLMTTATTLLALLTILTSEGRGSDVMIPMAIPCVGGMLVALLSLFVVPVLYSWRREMLVKN